MSDARAKLADFFSILLERNKFHSRADERLRAVEPKRLSRAEAGSLLLVAVVVLEEAIQLGCGDETQRLAH